MESLRGVWTYRSFFNAVGGQEPPGGIKLWEAELYLDIDPANGRVFGHLGERLDTTPGTDADGLPYPFLSVAGTYTEGNPVTLAFRATGRGGSAWEKWIYDYRCALTPEWPRQPGFNPASVQRPTLTGTVMRVVEHDGAAAGATYTFYAVKHGFTEPRVATPLPPAVVQMLASPAMRLHHQVWHASRDEWDDLTPEQKAWLRQNNWQPGPANAERPAGFRPHHYTNHSGEDFLFMHRRMIKAVKDIAGAAAPGGWGRLPEPTVLSNFAAEGKKNTVGNLDGFALPPAWIIPDDAGTTSWLVALRTAATYAGRFRVWEAQYTNPAWLETVTLGQLGGFIEWSIHNWMHMRWTSVQRDPASGLAVPSGRVNDDFDPRWFAPENDHLGATFSSHVNPVFWRIHGWVDNRIEDWFRAQENARPGVVKRRAFKDVSWFEKDGKWVNLDDPWEGPVAQGGHQHGDGGAPGHGGLDVELMKKAIIVIFRGTGALAMSTAALDALRSTGQPGTVSRFKNIFQDGEIEP